jgi:translocator protein
MDTTARPADGRDLARTIVTIVAFVATVAANSAANILPINGQTTAEISDRFRVFVVPAGYVFSIWSLIYLGLLAFTVYQALPGRGASPLVRRLGWLPALTGALNVAWIIAWHYEAFALTVPIMAALLATLVAIEWRIRGDGRRHAGAERWAVAVPFSIYTGLITVATIANVSAALASFGVTGGGIDPTLIASAVLVVGLVIAATMVLRFRDPAYGLVIVWAYVGIVVKESATPLVPFVAGAAAIVVAGLVVATLAGWTPGRRAAVGTPAGAVTTA